MKLGFYIILAAQFFSALADNALLFAAIALLYAVHAPDWQIPMLQAAFVASYIVLAPFVGAFADSLPKGRVMLIGNTIKLSGCIAMLAGVLSGTYSTVYIAAPLLQIWRRRAAPPQAA